MSNPYEQNLFKSAQKDLGTSSNAIYIGDKLQYEEGSGVIEDRSPTIISKGKGLTVSPIREDLAMSFTQRDPTEDPSSLLMIQGNSHPYQDPGSATAGFHRHHMSLGSPILTHSDDNLSPM